jgi:glutathione S-transferase
VEALLVDEVTASLDEMWSAAPFGGAPEELKAKREAWIAAISGKQFKYFERRLSESGGPFVLGSELSVADLWLFTLADMITTGFFDHVPRDLLEGFPGMNALYKAVKAHPVVVAHGA